MIFPKSKLPKYTYLAAFLLSSICGTSLFFAAGFPSSSPKFQDAGTFILLLAGRQIGTEKFQIRPSGGGIDARAEIQFKVSQDGEDLEFKTYPDLILNSQLQPLAYTWNQRGAKSSQIQINFRQSPATVRYRTIQGRTDNREFNLAQDVVILDDNVIDQYELLAWRYSMTAGGKQTFPAFIPQEALPGTIEVSSAGFETISAGRAQESCQHLIVSTQLARIDLWINSQRQLERMERTAEHFSAVRKH